MRNMTEVIGRRLNVPITSITPTAADRHFSWLARFVAMDNPVSSQLTREGRAGNHKNPA